MKVDKHRRSETFTGQDDGFGLKTDILTVGYTNWGEPYRSGARFEFNDSMGHTVCVDLEHAELVRLRDLLTDLTKG